MTGRLSTERIEEIRKRVEAITEGTWQQAFEADEELIEHARKDIPTMLAEIDRLNEENDLLKLDVMYYERKERNK